MSHATQLHNRGYLADYMQIMNRSALPGNVHDEVYGQVHAKVVATVKWTLEQAWDEEVVAYVGCGRYERGIEPRRPEETRSGSYERELWTQYGCIADLRVPKLRRGNARLHWQSIERYERCWGPFLDQQLLHYSLGHSLRDLQEAMHLTLGEVLSLQACNRLVWALKSGRKHSKRLDSTTHRPSCWSMGCGSSWRCPRGSGRPIAGVDVGR
jgi:hypothetical protein